MANQNRPTGFTPVKYLSGADWDGRGNLYYIDSTYGSAIYPGDMVVLAAGLDAGSGLQAINLAAASPTAGLLGSVLAIGKSSPGTVTSFRGGPFIDPTNLNQTGTYAPATKLTNYFALVADDPNIIYEAQEVVVSAHASLGKTNTSNTINLYAGTPATGVYISGQGLDNNTAATTNTLPLKLMGLVQRIDPQSGVYNAFGLYAKWLVKINAHAYGNIVAGV